MPVALSTFDFVIFLTSLIVVMVIGLWTGRKEEGTEDFFLAGRSVAWWGAADYIFDTNVSGEHLAGMLGNRRRLLQLARAPAPCRLPGAPR